MAPDTVLPDAPPLTDTPAPPPPVTDAVPETTFRPIPLETYAGVSVLERVEQFAFSRVGQWVAWVLFIVSASALAWVGYQAVDALQANEAAMLQASVAPEPLPPQDVATLLPPETVQTLTNPERFPSDTAAKRRRPPQQKKAHPKQPPETPPPLGSVNPNTAPASLLQRLPGVGPKLAERIIQYRKQHGPFTSLDELNNVKGIGEKKLMKMRRYLSIN